MSVKKPAPDAEAVPNANAATAPLPSGGGSYALVDGKLVPDAQVPAAADLTEV